MAEESLENLAGELLAENPKVHTAARNYLSAKLALIANSSLNPVSFQKVIGSLLRALNSRDILNPIEWATQYPQPESQSGMDRIEDIRKYKLVHMVRQRLIDNKELNLKPTNSLGKTLVVVLLPQLKEHVVNECMAAFPEEEIISILSEFMEGNLEELVWTLDFKATLKTRAAQRAETAAKRVKELDDLMAGSTIEELPDQEI